MKKLIATTSMLALLGFPALAGGVVEPMVDDTITVKESPSSSSGGIIVPLLLLAIIAAAVASNGGDDEAQESDRRIKTDVQWVGMAKGLPVYQYRYIGTSQRFEGVMAQDVLAKDPGAVVTRSNGLMAVKYARLGLTLKTLH